MFPFTSSSLSRFRNGVVAVWRANVLRNAPVATWDQLPRAASRPHLVYFKPDYAQDTSPETNHQIDGLKDAEAEEVSEKWNIEHKTERKKGSAENPP